jgi:hypothetical protein
MTKTKNEFTINHVKHWSPTDGTCYRQTINIRRQTFDRLKQAMDVQKSTEQQRPDFLHSPLEYVGNLVMMNLTQRNFTIGFLNLYGKTTDDNTCLCIIDSQATRDIVNKAIIAHTAQIREILATYSTDSQYTEQILRAVGSIEATAKRATSK